MCIYIIYIDVVDVVVILNDDAGGDGDGDGSVAGANDAVYDRYILHI